MTEAARRDTPKPDVVLIGRNDFQNKLLARMITERIGCSCLVRSIEDLRGPSFDANVLALLDVARIAARDIIGFYPARKAARLDPIEALRYE